MKVYLLLDNTSRFIHERAGSITDDLLGLKARHRDSLEATATVILLDVGNHNARDLGPEVELMLRMETRVMAEASQ